MAGVACLKDLSGGNLKLHRFLPHSFPQYVLSSLLLVQHIPSFRSTFASFSASQATLRTDFALADLGSPAPHCLGPESEAPNAKLNMTYRMTIRLFWKNSSTLMMNHDLFNDLFISKRCRSHHCHVASDCFQVTDARA